MADSIDFVNLREKDLRKEGLFVAEGALLVERSIRAGYTILHIYANATAAKELRSLFDFEIPLTICERDEMDTIAGFPFHRGILALVVRPVLPSWSPCFLQPLIDATPSRVLVLPAITDPGNLGTLLRSSLAFGFKTVLLGSQSCDPFNRKALRSSMGATLELSLYNAESESLLAFAEAGMPVYAAEMRENALVAGMSLDLPFGVVLVLGNEFEGISDEWRKKCTRSIQIPVSAAVDSLNVAIAGSVLMWELTRQKPL